MWGYSNMEPVATIKNEELWAAVEKAEKEFEVQVAEWEIAMDLEAAGEFNAVPTAAPAIKAQSKKKAVKGVKMPKLGIKSYELDTKRAELNALEKESHDLQKMRRAVKTLSELEEVDSLIKKNNDLIRAKQFEIVKAIGKVLDAKQQDDEDKKSIKKLAAKIISLYKQREVAKTAEEKEDFTARICGMQDMLRKMQGKVADGNRVAKKKKSKKTKAVAQENWNAAGSVRTIAITKPAPASYIITRRDVVALRPVEKAVQTYTTESNLAAINAQIEANDVMKAALVKAGLVKEAA